MEQIPLQTVGMQRANGYKTSLPKESAGTVGNTNSFESLLAEKSSMENSSDVDMSSQSREEPEKNTALLEKVAADLAWGNKIVDVAFLQQELPDSFVQTYRICAPISTDILQPEALLETAEVGTEFVQVDPSPPQVLPIDLQSSAEKPSDNLGVPSSPLDVDLIQNTDADSEIKILDPISSRSQTTFSETSAEQDMEIADTEAALDQPFFQNFDSMPLKVGDGAPLDTEKAEFDSRFSSAIQQASEQGLSKITVQLTPENLGKVTVELSRDLEGMLHVVLHAESERATQLLKEHSSVLSEMLQNSTPGQVRVEVPSQQSTEESWQQPDQQHSGNQQPREQKNQRQNTEDFLNQLRLGLLQENIL